MAHAVEAGAQVEVLTVFACEPGSSAPTDDWDRKSGFASEGEAATQRRIEDRLACSILGAAPRWLGFGAQPYDRHGSMEEVMSAVAAATAGADTILIPGYPLAHADHAALSRALLCRGLPCRMLALYAEQPYSFDRRLSLHGPVETLPAEAPGGAARDSAQPANSFTWQRSATDRRHRRLKLQAVKQYQSQLRSLGLRQRGVGHLRLRMMLWDEARRGGETIAWPKAT